VSNCSCGHPLSAETMRASFDGVAYHWNCAADMRAGRPIGTTRQRLSALQLRLATGPENADGVREVLLALLDEALQR